MFEIISDVLRYVRQMLPMCLVALVVFLALYPQRQRRLQKNGLSSSPLREVTLCLFVLFCAGLSALTLFPANFWTYLISFGRAYPEGFTWMSFYPSWEQILREVPYLPDMLTPFQEIRRALSSMSYWLLFMLLGNIVMFMPVGFFPALLWRGWRWWKSVLTGFLTSCLIEFVQFFIGRSTDIDDVILNTTGALLGYLLFCILRALCPGWIRRFQCKAKGDETVWTI